ncbi:MAG: ComF family protein [Lachnospiraceae bacterium]|nr:ComF family protein [Lachnospiraceae bacterium]
MRRENLERRSAQDRSAAERKRRAAGAGAERAGTKRAPKTGAAAEAASKIWRGVLQLLFPLRCPVCDDIVVPAGEKICLECLGKLELLTPPWCMKCGKKLPREGEFCADCMKKRHVFRRGRALYAYESAAPSIYRFKYGGRREYADFYGEQMAQYLGSYIRGLQPDALLPVPLHRRRMAARGYNQAQLIAEAVGRRLGVPVYTDFLVRVKNTAPLKYENPKERQNNLKKAFNIARNDVKLKRVVLVDDIYTTGSTMDEAAETLKEAGAEEVFFIALACGTGI